MRQSSLQTAAKILQNPIWLIAGVVVLTLLSTYLFLPWWVAGLVALIWGGWLLQQSLVQGESNRLDEPSLAPYLAQAQAYNVHIRQVIQASGNTHNQLHLTQLKRRLDNCVKAIEALVERLGHLRQNDLIQRDMAAVPEAIARLDQQLRSERNQESVARLEQVLALRRNQLALLEQLELAASQTELQIEHTISLLGTIYSQLLIGQSTNEIADYDRLAASIDEEVSRLEDHLEALQEVKGGYRIKPVSLSGRTSAVSVPPESDTHH